MSWTLLRARTGVRSTDALVVRIVRLSVETGTLCAAFALLDLIFYLTFKHNNFHMIPSIALTKMYSNSYFAVCIYWVFSLSTWSIDLNCRS